MIILARPKHPLPDSYVNDRQIYANKTQSVRKRKRKKKLPKESIIIIIVKKKLKRSEREMTT